MAQKVLSTHNRVKTPCPMSCGATRCPKYSIVVHFTLSEPPLSATTTTATPGLRPSRFCRQQRERQSQLEAAAEEERRRKQAEQQEQLDGLYRQQEEALRKKRGGGGGSGGGRQLNDTEDSSSSSRAAADPRAPAYGGSSTPSFDDNGGDEAVAPGYFASDGHVGGGSGLRQSQSQRQQRHVADATPVDSSRGAIRGGGRGQTPRRWSSVPDVDDLPAGAQARAQVLRSSPPQPTTARGGGGGVGDGGGGTSARSPSSWRPGSASSERHGNRSPGGAAAAATANRRFNMEYSMEETGHEGDAPAAEQNRVRTTRAVACGSGGRGSGTAATATAAAAPAGPPLQARSSLVPVSSTTLFPPFLADVDTDTKAHASTDVPPLTRINDPRLVLQQSFAGNEPGGGIRYRDNDDAGPPQDEMDAFVTRWQDEHLRRRGRRSQGQSQQGVGGEMAEVNGHRPVSFSPGGRTICSSPSRSVLVGSSRARGSMNSIRARGSAGPGGKVGELEESLAATSRMVNPPFLPLGGRVGGGAALATAGGSDGDDGRQPQGPVRHLGGGGGGGGGGGDRGGEADLSEQSLTSDSILFYLSGQQQEEPLAVGEGRASANHGGATSTTNRTYSGIATGRLRSGRVQTSEMDEMGEGRRGYGLTSRGRVAEVGTIADRGDPLGATPSMLLPPGRGVSAQREEDDGDHGQMSPLTRLLAETPVRLKAPGDSLRPKPGTDPAGWVGLGWGESCEGLALQSPPL